MIVDWTVWLWLVGTDLFPWGTVLLAQAAEGMDLSTESAKPLLVPYSGYVLVTTHVYADTLLDTSWIRTGLETLLAMVSEAKRF